MQPQELIKDRLRLVNLGDVKQLVIFLLVVFLSFWRIEKERSYLWDEDLGEGSVHVVLESTPRLEEGSIKVMVKIVGGDFPEIYDKRGKLTLIATENVPSKSFIVNAKVKVKHGFVFLSANYRDIEKVIFEEPSIRERYIKRAMAKIENPEVEGLVLTYLFGESAEGLSQDIQAAFYKTGLVHMLVISGFHVGMIFMILRVGAPQPFGSIIGMLGIVLYVWLLVPHNPPVLRATVMILLFIAVKLLQGAPNSLAILLFSGSLLLLVSPEFVVSYSFWLSFWATLYIIVALRNFKKEQDIADSFLIAPAWVSLFAFLGVTPLLLTFSNTSMGSIIFSPIVGYLFFPFTAYGVLELLTFFSLPTFPLEWNGIVVLKVVEILSMLDLRLWKGMSVTAAVICLILNALVIYLTRGFEKLIAILIFIVFLVFG